VNSARRTKKARKSSRKPLNRARVERVKSLAGDAGIVCTVYDAGAVAGDIALRCKSAEPIEKVIGALGLELGPDDAWRPACLCGERADRLSPAPDPRV
jgi:hypothetical protein